MKRITNSRYKSPALAFAAMLLGAALLVPVTSTHGDNVVNSAGGVSYVSGGIGTDSIDRLSAMARDFNLKLVFALKSGAYVSGVGVVIADAAGRPLVNTTSEGPWLLARLPAGNYQVVATFAGNAVKRQIAVGSGTLRTVDFQWASE